MKESFIDVVSSCGRDSDSSSRIDLGHNSHFLFHLLVIILYDTECIDPEIFQSEPPCSFYRIPNSLWERLKWPSFQPLLEIVPSCLRLLIAPPAIAESCVRNGFFIICWENTDRIFLLITDLEKMSWAFLVLQRLPQSPTIFVILTAILEPVSHGTKGVF